MKVLILDAYFLSYLFTAKLLTIQKLLAENP